MHRPLAPSMGLLLTVVLCASCATPTASAPPPPPPPPAPAAAAPPPRPPALRLPGNARPLRYAVDLTLVPTRETLTGAIDIDLAFREPTPVLWLNASELAVQGASLVLNGKTHAVQQVASDDDFIGLALTPPAGPGEGRLHLTYEAKISSRETEGVFRQQDGDAWYAYTHFEAMDARRAFPCFDEPAFKVPWQLTLHVRKEDKAFSNTPAEQERDEPGGMKAVQFAQTSPLPSYLVAFGVGPFDVIDLGKAGAQHTPVRIIVPKGRAEDAGYAVQSTVALVEGVESYFGTPYPYAKLDLLVIPITLSFGAMENPGLITFGQKYILEKKGQETVENQRRYATYAAHEIAHQWFGDLVTMQWWDDVWLNESFANWLQDRIIGQWKPAWDAPVMRMHGRRAAMDADSLTSARRIRQPIETKGDIVNAFDDITYEKGGAILSMFEAWVGPDTLRRGIQRYLKTHAHGNATAADFLAAISAETGRDVSRTFSTFLDQPGVPLVSVALSCPKGEVPRLELEQRRYLPAGSKGSAAQRWEIPLCARYSAAGKPGRACTVLAEPRGALALEGAAACPDWVLPNDGELGYYRASLQGDLLRRLLNRGSKQLTVAERVGLLNDVGAAVINGDTPAADLLALLPDFISDGNWHLQLEAVRVVRHIKLSLVPQELKPNYRRLVQRLFGAKARALGWKAAKGEPEEVRLLRPDLVGLVAEYGNDEKLASEAKALAERWLEDKSALDPEVVDAALRVAARRSGTELYERMYVAAKKAVERHERVQLFQAMGAFLQPELVRRSFEIMGSGEFDLRDARVLGQYPLSHEETRELAFQLIKDSWPRLVEKVPRVTLPGMAYSGAGFCDQPHRMDVEAFFKDRSAKEPGGARILAQVLEMIDLCIALKERQQPSVAAFLKKY